MSLRLGLLKLLIFLISIDGVIKGIFSSIGLYPLAFIKDGVIFIMLIVAIYDILAFEKIKKNVFYVGSVVIFSIAIAVFNNVNFLQILFALRIFIIFPVMLILRERISIIRLRSFLIHVMLLTFIGLLTNVFVDFPWEGSMSNIGDLEVRVGASGTIGGIIKRVSGFGATNGTTASLVLSLWLLLCLMNLNDGKSKIISRTIWVIAFISLLLTTFKTAILAFVVLTVIMFLLSRKLKNCNRELSIYLNIINLGVVLYTFVPVIVSYLFFNSFGTPANVAFDSLESETSRITISTLFARMYFIWPEVFEFLLEGDYLMLGRGFGGIGVAQKIFEPTIYNPGDGFIVTLIAFIGVIATFCFLMYSLYVMFFYRSNAIITKVLIVFVLLIGATHNVVDNPISLICVALFINIDYYCFKTIK